MFIIFVFKVFVYEKPKSNANILHPLTESVRNLSVDKRGVACH